MHVGDCICIFHLVTISRNNTMAAAARSFPESLLLLSKCSYKINKLGLNFKQVIEVVIIFQGQQGKITTYLVL